MNKLPITMTLWPNKTCAPEIMIKPTVRIILNGVMVFLLTLANIVKADTLVIGTYLRYDDPLSVASEAVLKEAYRRINVPVTFKDLPISRAMNMMLAGKIDGNIYRIKKLGDERPELIRVEPAINAVVIRAYTKGPLMSINSWRDLTGYRVTYMRGVLIIENNLPANIKTFTATTEKEAIRITSTKAADIMLFAEALHIPPDAYATTHQLYRLAATLSEAPLYHYLTAKHIDTAKKLSTTLRQMEHSGEIQQIQFKALEAMKKNRAMQ